MVDMGSPGWMDRYAAGHRSEVWHELRQLGATIDEDARIEAEQVCDAMACRAKANVETIIERLTDQGYRFHNNDVAQSPKAGHIQPGHDAPAIVDWLQTRFAAVPMTLVAWLRIVGDVWLVGSHPQWTDAAAADPLVIEAEGSHYPGSSIADYFEGELDAYKQWSAGAGDDTNPFVLPLAPDRLHKDNVSGGPPYGIILPDGCADGLFVAETTMPFVAYLNWVFQHGGFPGRSSSPDAWKVRQSVAKDLLPL
jgi:hypothetical protein